MIVRGLRTLVALVVAGVTLHAVSRWGTDDRATWLVVARDPAALDGRGIALRSKGILAREIPHIGVFTILGGSDVGQRLAADPLLRVVRIAETDFSAASVPLILPPRELFTQTIDDDFYFAGQWALQAIHAPEAWATGARGAGVRIAVLDTGVDPTHPDLAVNVNVALARSFVPGQSWDVSTDLVQDFDHGTHVAGIIAAADNAFGVIGVAPDAQIVPIQVLRRPSGTGPPDAVIAGIVYAADIGADVINLSLAYTRFRHGGINDLGTEDPSDDVAYTSAEAAALAVAFARAAEYAHARGATIITGTHNNSRDGNRDADLFVLPRESPHVLTVAATGPLGWAINPTVDLDTPAFYTNYGQSIVDVSAPGGNIDFGLLASGAPCTVGSGPISITLPCWLFDGVLSTAPVQGGFLFQFRTGTSMASAHVSGVAALVIGANGGSMSPQQVRARLRSSVEDLGKAGKDEFYGLGRINALAAVQ